ncbi:hypothetical protein SAMN05216260_108147 [Streptomyces griseoaurantiacus]|uniref:Uncharacterized protein n=1 Tax=Streptomyces griseoaurantiacus TaxID=68213 RepID=A0A1G7L962_9ACTN|nr:hypothetical protein SAMN05216260_108147 [Streptomyces jietaisiensis]
MTSGFRVLSPAHRVTEAITDTALTDPNTPRHVRPRA